MFAKTHQAQWSTTRRLRRFDLVGIRQKLEMHGVFEFITAKPIKSVTLECVHPTRRNFRVIKWCFCWLFANRRIFRRRDTITTRVPLRIDVDRNAVQVIAYFIVVKRIANTQTVEHARRVRRIGASLLNRFFHASKRHENFGIHPNVDTEEARFRGVIVRWPRIHRDIAETFNEAVMPRAVRNRGLMQLFPFSKSFGRESST